MQVRRTAALARVLIARVDLALFSRDLAIVVVRREEFCAAQERTRRERRKNTDSGKQSVQRDQTRRRPRERKTQNTKIKRTLSIRRDSNRAVARQPVLRARDAIDQVRRARRAVLAAAVSQGASNHVYTPEIKK